jgi:hypothetical protein
MVNTRAVYRAIKAVRENPFNYIYLPDDLKANEEIAQIAVSRNPMIYYHLSEKMKKIFDICFTAVSGNDAIYQSFDQKMKENIYIIQEYINPEKGRQNNFGNLPYAIAGLVQKDFFYGASEENKIKWFSYLPEDLKTYERAMSAFQEDLSNVLYMPTQFVTREMVLEYIQEHDYFLETLHDDISHFIPPQILLNKIMDYHERDKEGDGDKYLEDDHILESISVILSSYSPQDKQPIEKFLNEKNISLILS